jgi:co-chaperonin GroES (HSP10)
MKLLPVGDRCLIRVELITKKTTEGESTDISREATIVESSSPDFKKGTKIYYNPRGCINIETLSTKKYILLIIDACDIYGVIVPDKKKKK